MNAGRIEEVLKIHEGFERYPYECTQGKLTIGIGRNIEDKGFTSEEKRSIYKNVSDEKFLSYISQYGINEIQAALLLGNDIKDCKKQLLNILYQKNYLSLSEIRREVLINMIFNIGYYSFNSFSGMIRNIRRNNIPGVAQEMLDSQWAGQVGQRARDLAFSYLDNNWIIKGERKWQ